MPANPPPRLPAIPAGSVLGLNYSGMHDSAIAIVAPDGRPVYAASLERISRVKQDGRPPTPLLENIPWERIECAGISTYESLGRAAGGSRIHPAPLASRREGGLEHEAGFHRFLESIPCEKIFVGHQVSHASSAFWGSGFRDALCLTYDGGMANDPWFGGLFRCDAASGIEPLDLFEAAGHAKVTSIYTVVTALLGFTPNKHEGKITGLAAYGRPSARALELLERWLGADFLEVESALRWVFAYDEAIPPQFLARSLVLQRLREQSRGIARDEMAASVQHLAERHVLAILSNARTLGWVGERMCLAGGLFANVKINQRIAEEAGFAEVFVAPPMTDDGTALGAAWQALAKRRRFAPRKLDSMYLGPAYEPGQTQRLLAERGIVFEKLEDAPGRIAQLIADGAVVAVYQGASEFGPRALGNRSILAAATHPGINESLNRRLDRTEFMPFAPVSRDEDAQRLYHGIDRVRHAAEFMTVTLPCTEEMKRDCPAVVHVDGTARPQLLRRETNPLVYDVLSRYFERTGRRALVNTSFNIHEEPIVCSPEDALRGFFESGLDHLYLQGIGLVRFAGNEHAAVSFLHERMHSPGPKQAALAAVISLLEKEHGESWLGLEEKEAVIQSLAQALDEARTRYAEAVRGLEEKEAVIRDLREAIAETRALHAQSAAHSAERESVTQALRDSVRIAEENARAAGRRLEEKESIMRTLQQALEDNGLLVRELRNKDVSGSVQASLVGIEAHAVLVRGLEEKEKVIQEMKKALDAYRAVFSFISCFTRPISRVIPLSRLARLHPRNVLPRPRLGTLFHHEPKDLVVPASYSRPIPLARAPKISVVTPSFHQGAFIERTIRSLLDQGYPNLEYFVQDGGSDDGTREILQRYSEHLTGWESRADGGQSHAINQGFARTSGEIMAWLNSDDILLPGSINCVADFFSRNPDVDVIYGHRLLIDENDRLIGRWILPAHDDDILSWADYVPQETLFWRRRIWEKAGGQVDESFRFAMDWDLLVRFRSAGARFVRIPRFLGGFRIHPHQKTSAAITETGFKEMERIRERALGRVPNSDEVRRAVTPYLLRHVGCELGWRIRIALGGNR